MEGQHLAGSEADYGEGVALGHGVCGHSGTINGFSTDMYYIEKVDASLVINVNRLDRDNRSQSTPIFGIVSRTILSARAHGRGNRSRGALVAGEFNPSHQPECFVRVYLGWNTSLCLSPKLGYLAQ
jgi:hypothetical protein